MSNLALDRKTNDLIPLFEEVVSGLTNRLLYSEDLSNPAWVKSGSAIFKSSGNSELVIHTVTDLSGSVTGSVRQSVSLPVFPNYPLAMTCTLDIAKDITTDHTVSFPAVELKFDSLNTATVGLDISTGEYNVLENIGNTVDVTVSDVSGFWRLSVTKSGVVSSDMVCKIYPTFGSGSWVKDILLTGSINVASISVVEGRISYPYTKTLGSYIPPQLVKKPKGFARVSKGRYVVQLIKSKMLTSLGEYLLNPSIGWLDIEKDLDRGYDLFALELRARELILETEGVQAIQSMTLTVLDRKLSLSFKATTVYGEINETIPWR